MAKKNYTRKELKQPDEFITASTRAWEWVSTNIKGVVAGAIVCLAIIGIAALWRSAANKSAQVATAQLSRATEIFNQTVAAGAPGTPTGADDLPRFSTTTAKLKAAEAEYDKTIKEQSGRIADFARLLRAGVRLDLGQYAAAQKDYNEFLQRAGGAPEAFRVAALEGLSYALAAQKQWDQALKALAKLPKKDQAQYVALYQEGRILAAQGKHAEADKLFQKVVDKSSSRFLVEQAGQLIASAGPQ